ncbi:MAG TPA: hypothetical protein VNK43_10195 [Gemmatimonadales bacterium]|nr:hypothetical protein [Gemmatimonadales bacterium]
MIFGRGFWIVVWYGMLLLGVLGFAASIYWGRLTGWKNLDEFLRAVGTIFVSIGMILLLEGVALALGQLFLVIALGCFVAAFVQGRRGPPPRTKGRRATD